MRVLVSGATGLIGSALVARLGQTGHAAIRLVRTDPDPGGTDVRWDPAAGALDPAAVEGLDAVVHLAGEDIASGAWTDAKKARIRASRVDATALLARTVAGRSRPPAVLASASAVGYYGDRGDEVLTEESSAGTGFLASVCREWDRRRHRRARPASACYTCASAWSSTRPRGRCPRCSASSGRAWGGPSEVGAST